ncbi:MAG: hypothetical protein KDC92_01440 [Bacteroidetes bacterium]|nr:hypothetical protein [Bacteroidota bacterium]
MNQLKSFIFIIGFVGLLGFTKGQTTYEYRLIADSTNYAIGAKVVISQQWVFPTGSEVKNPGIPDTIGPLIRVDAGETFFEKSGENTVATRISEYTSLDTGRHITPVLKWYYSEKQYIESNQLEFYFSLYKVDTALPVKPIAEIKDAPFTTAEILKMVAIGVGSVGTLAAILWLLLVYLPRKKQQQPGTATQQKTPYEIAIEKLKVVRRFRLDSNEEIKQYHAELSEIFREFVHYHFAISVLDLTTPEMLERLNLLKLEQANWAELSLALQMGDMAKFAKQFPSEAENQNCLIVIETFIEKFGKSKPQETELNQN